jgi:hypothetical protein
MHIRTSLEVLTVRLALPQIAGADLHDELRVVGEIIAGGYVAVRIVSRR